MCQLLFLPKDPSRYLDSGIYRKQLIISRQETTAELKASEVDTQMAFVDVPSDGVDDNTAEGSIRRARCRTF